MFGLTLDKLVVLAIFAGLVIGPHRLAAVTRTAVDVIRSLRSFVETQRAQLVADTGISLASEEWRGVDIRQYDPRRIIRDALRAPATPLSSQAPASALAERTPAAADDGKTEQAEDARPAAPDAGETPRAEGPRPIAGHVDEAPVPVRPGQKYLIIGDSAHPRRIRIADLPPDDPRRIAAFAHDSPLVSDHDAAMAAVADTVTPLDDPARRRRCRARCQASFHVT